MGFLSLCRNIAAGFVDGLQRGDPIRAYRMGGMLYENLLVGLGFSAPVMASWLSDL